MIKRHVSVVIAASDWYTNRPLNRGALLISEGDTALCPEYREGGYFVLCDLADTTHNLTVRSAGFFDEEIIINCDSSRMERISLRMKPSPLYGVPSGASALRIKSENPLYIMPHRFGGMKTAQDTTDIGDIKCSVFIKNKGARILLPQNVVIGGDEPEDAVICSAGAGAIVFASPLKKRHARSSPLMPAELYTPRGGIIYALIHPEGTSVYDESSGAIYEAADAQINQTEKV